MSFWNIWLIFRDLINRFKKTLVFFFHVTSKRFRQDSNYWSSVVRDISNSMFLLKIDITSFFISQNIWSNFLFNFMLIIVLKTFIIFSGWRMLVRILFFRICYLTKNVCDCLILIFLIIICNFCFGCSRLINISFDN